MHAQTLEQVVQGVCVESPSPEILTPTWMGLWATCASCPCFELGAKLDDFQVVPCKIKKTGKKICIVQTKLARVEWKFLSPLQISMLVAKSSLRQMSFNNFTSTSLSGRGTHVQKGIKSNYLLTTPVSFFSFFLTTHQDIAYTPIPREKQSLSLFI